VSDAHGRDRTGDEKQRSRRHAGMVRPMDAEVDPVGDDENKACGHRERSKTDCNGESEAGRGGDGGQLRGWHLGMQIVRLD
jgi:hypothetical protein